MNIDKAAGNLNRNGIETFFVEKKSDVVPLLKKMIKTGDVVGLGGSMTLFECDVIDFLRDGDYQLLDRYADNLTGSEMNDVFIKSYAADVYLTSCNAVTENGELYNVDGRSNRISAIAHGPKSVIFIVSVNKIVKNIDEAILRVKTIAAPKNCVRLNCNTYCKEKGRCMSLLNENPSMTDGCDSKDRICSNYLVSAKQRTQGRMKVVFIGEDAGF
ncbi:MAG: lactate utilization protein [Saccharofermentanales bacterium]